MLLDGNNNILFTRDLFIQDHYLDCVCVCVCVCVFNALANTQKNSDIRALVSTRSAVTFLCENRERERIVEAYLRYYINTFFVSHFPETCASDCN